MSRRKSRLSVKTEKRTRKTILLTSLGILIILILLIKFGVNLLVGFSVFLAGTKNQASVNLNSSSNTFITAPVLDPLPNATNSANIIISGKSQPNKTINLYINNDLKDTAQSDKTGSFLFEEILSTGNNKIDTKTEQDNKSSDSSNSFTVVFKNNAPSLNIDSPSDGQSLTKDQNSIAVKGKTEQGITVTVNGFWAIIDENNNFSYNLPLQNGDNQIKVIATDQAGNNTERDLKVNYSP
jgi:bacillopeptidase F